MYKSNIERTHCLINDFCGHYFFLLVYILCDIMQIFFHMSLNKIILCGN